jgi:hypothetical protein
MLTAAAAQHRVPVMLDGPGADLFGQVGDLMGVPHPQIIRAGQVRAALTRTGREMRHRVVGVIVPGQVRARRAGLLARLALPGAARLLPAGGVRPGWSSLLGAIEEFPEFREISRSRRASLSFSAAFSAASDATSPRSSATSARSCSFSARSRLSAASYEAAASGVSGTPVPHHSQPSVSNRHRQPAGATLNPRTPDQGPECLPLIVPLPSREKRSIEVIDAGQRALMVV